MCVPCHLDYSGFVNCTSIFLGYGCVSIVLDGWYDIDFALCMEGKMDAEKSSMIHISEVKGGDRDAIIFK